jgi:hypothetical protein
MRETAPRGFSRQFVPVPTVYLDRAMPVLTDTELRVLLVVIRQTLGWTAGSQNGTRKERDWISLRQFEAKTGRGHTALSRAIQGLVEQEVILVEDRSANPLRTPRQRERCRGRLYYRLLPPFPDGAFDHAVARNEGGNAPD